MGDKKCTAGGRTRLRLSTWVDSPQEKDPRTKEQKAAGVPPPHVLQWKEGLLHFNKWLLAKNQNKLEDPTTREQLGHRFRDAKGLLDDFSLIKTIFLENAQGAVNWHRGDAVDASFIPAANDDQRKAYCEFMIDLCHEQGIQLLAGYGVGDEGLQKKPKGQAFVAFLNQANAAKLQAHAANIVTFLYTTQQLNFDGVSFDLEINGLNKTHAEKMGIFYDALATKLAEKKGILAFATGIGVKSGDPLGTDEDTLGTFMAQPFRLAKKHKNVIVRAMAYDANLNEEAKLREWHQAIVDYALNTAKLDPGQFQLGIKTHTGNSAVTKKENIEFRCRDILRCKNVGLVTFALLNERAVKDQFEFVNTALNKKAPPSGTLGQPVQVPLDKAAISLFKNAGFKTKAVPP